MVKVIMGLKGSGKTKQLIDLVHAAVNQENGEVVCIEKGQKLTYDIPHAVRLIEASNYGFDSYDFLKGFISGLHAENYDITHIFIDSLLKIIDQQIDSRAEDFVEWCESFSERENIKFTITISADASLATEGIRKYF
ncbi:hypothetical protein SAMN02745823_02481 [Sporobacter termitidis DSM 10068]|uniref:Zonular occludens toxin (Zot) n=1 Tax=Sporobacter termitidis DSM 10068 TaxID=1123282 RepID=A0A1M5YFX7_9FIRM|nr:hypothetical protein [Sporobacter termitidis]SHI10794.1 hypothetical protein SAMN02745823_02481 [Sporobacter termitidis DSM 10068]